MIASGDHPGAAPADLEIVSTRVFNAAREQIFQAFSDPDLLARWWGPKGFSNTFQEFDLRPGGVWRFVMHGPDGSSFPMLKEVIEVVYPERIVLLHPDPQHQFQMTITLAAQDESTQLTWRMLFESAAEFERIKDIVPGLNEQNFDRLEAQLAATA